jgi:hypothetical protein
MTNIFEQAARKKLRFDTSLGRLSAEDLWDLPLLPTRTGMLACLNQVAVGLHRTIQENTISFVEPESKTMSLDQLRFDIVKHIIDVRKAEQVAALEAGAKAERKQKLLGVLARKQDAALEQMSEEDIRKLIEEV